jgi:hypothetical protein
VKSESAGRGPKGLSGHGLWNPGVRKREDGKGEGMAEVHGLGGGSVEHVPDHLRVPDITHFASNSQHLVLAGRGQPSRLSTH